MVRVVSCARRGGKRCRELGMIESRRASPFRRIYQHELDPFRRSDPIPEALVRQPGRAHAGTEYQRKMQKERTK